MAGLGLEQTIALGIQASKATPTTQARTLINAYSFDGGLTEGRKPDALLPAGLNNIYDSTPSAPAIDDHKLTLVTPLDEVQFALVLLAFFGTATDSGAGPYVHDFSSGAASVPYVFFEKKLGASDFRQHISCVGETLDINLDAEKEGFGQVTTTWVGITETPSATTMPGVVTAAPALIRNPQRNNNNTYNGVAAQIGGKISFKRQLKRLRNSDGTGVPYDVVRNDVNMCDGSWHVRYKDQTLTTDQIARQKRQAIVELLTSATQGIRFTVPNHILARTPEPLPGPAGIEYDLPWTAEQSSAAAMFKATILNATAVLTGP